MADLDLWSGLAGAVIGGLIGALVTGAAQIWSYRAGARATQRQAAQRAACSLLEDLSFCESVLIQLPFTKNPPESSLSYSEKRLIGRSMLDRLEHADNVTVPLLAETALMVTFDSIHRECIRLTDVEVDFTEIHPAVKAVREQIGTYRAGLRSFARTGKLSK